MRRLSFAVFVLLLGGIWPAEAAEEPRALIERAVKVMGGAEALQQSLAIRMKIKVKSYPKGAGEAISMEGEAWEFGERSRLSLQVDLSGNKFAVTMVAN